jgi:hypothetical protein
MHTEPRNGAEIQRIYLHTNEGSEEWGGAAGLAHYLENNGPDGGGYHVISGDTLERIASDDTIVWGAGGDNEHSLHIVFEGFANQTPEQWADAFSQKEIVNAVSVVAQWCKDHGIPAVRARAGAPGKAPTDRGIVRHADNHDPRSQGHTDPGDNFPMDDFVKLVAAKVSPPVDWAALKKLSDWKRRVSRKPLLQGQTSPDVTTLKQLLAVKGYPVGNTEPFYGPDLVNVVLKFKHDRLSHQAHIDPTRFGAAAAAALLS